MQAPPRGTHGTSLYVTARMRGRDPAPVPSLEPARGGAAPDTGTVTGAALRARRTLILAVCCTSLFMVGLDLTIVNVGLPSIGRDLHAGVSGLQWTVAAYTITLAALLMFSGAVADRIGRRTIFQVGLSLFTLGSWLCSLAPGLGALIAFRVLQGVGGSMLNPAALGIITNTFTGPAERARAIGVWDGVFGLSMALGPLLGGVLVGAAGWRGIFWANIPVGLAAISLTALFVPDSKAPRSRRADPAGQFLIIVMLGSLAYAIIEGPTDGWHSPQIFGFFALSAAALSVLLAYEPRREEPMLDFRFFRSVPFAGANLTAVCAIAAMAGFLFLSTLYLQDVRGLSALQAGQRGAQGHHHRHRQDGQAGLQRGQPPDVLQVQGGQEEEPGHRGNGADRGEVGARERHAAEEPEVDHRLRAARLVGEQHGERGRGQREEAEDLR